MASTRRRFGLRLGLGLLLTGCADERTSSSCNGHPEFCERRFDELSYVTTHNAHASVAEGYLEGASANQRPSMLDQLKDGVRAFMLDTAYHEGVPSLCHGACEVGGINLGRQALVPALQVFNDWLEQNPREVITFILQAGISDEDTVIAFEQAGLLRYVYAHDKATPWPTLSEMLDRDLRLVVFTDSPNRKPPWHMWTYDHAWENDYEATTPEELSCGSARGAEGAPLYLLNHFLTAPLASPSLAEQINYNPFLEERISGCQRAFLQRPNFIAVDYYTIGDIFTVVNNLNGVALPGAPAP